MQNKKQNEKPDKNLHAPMPQRREKTHAMTKYDVYLDGVLFPVPPGKLTVKINNGNKTCTLMNEGEINMLKMPGLTEIEFELLLPNSRYPFAIYEDGFQKAEVYLHHLERLKAEKRAFQFIVHRNILSGTEKFDTNITCSLESYSIIEDAEANGTDVTVSVSLKQYRNYGVKRCRVRQKKILGLKKLRNKKFCNLPASQDGTVSVFGKKGKDFVAIKIKKKITLYNLALKLYGDGSNYKAIAKANHAEWKQSKTFQKGDVIVIPLTYYRSEEDA